MKKVVLLIGLFCFFQQVTFGQNKSSKKYQLNKLDTEQTYTTKEFAYKLENTGEGIILSEYRNKKLEISILKSTLEIHYVDTFVGTTMERIVKKDTMQRETIAKGISSKRTCQNILAGKKILFKRKKDSWSAPEFELYDPEQRGKISMHLDILNTGNGNRIQDFIYPDYMRIGDTFQVTNKNFNNFYDLSEVTSSSGTFTLKDVVVENDETIAVFEVDFKINGLYDTDEASIDFKGTIKRSISKFYDKEIDVMGETTFRMERIKTYSKEYSKLFLTRKLY